MGLIPTAKSKPKEKFEENLTLIYGAPKIGKSTFCAGLDSPLFLDTESGLNNLEVFKIGIDSWDTFKEVYGELKEKKGKLPFKTLIIDTIDNLYEMCSEYICKKNNILHESEMGYGKGYKMIEREFNMALAAYRQLGLGMIYTSHADAREITTRVGKYNRYEPTMNKRCAECVLPSVDFILYAENKEEKDGSERRVIHTKPSKYWNAGDKTGKLPEEIPLDAKAFMEEFKKTKESK